MSDTQISAAGAIGWQDAHDLACPTGKFCSAHGNPYILVPSYDPLRVVRRDAWDEGYIAKEDYQREYEKRGLDAVGQGNPYSTQ
jgi:hypothetical protein